MNRAALIFVVVQTVSAACIPITGDRISGADLATADSTLAVFPVAITVAFSPPPGSSLILGAAEIARIAKLHAVVLPAPPSDVCFAFAMHKISHEEAIAAMQRSLPSGASVDIVELAATDLPVGELRFSLTGLAPATDPRQTDVQVWRGFVQYTPTRRASVLARVRVRNGLEELVLTSDVPRGTVLTKEMFSTTPIPGLVPRQPVATRPEQALGRVAKTDLKAGQRIPLASVALPFAVQRGDIVSVEIRSGSARLQLDAIAQRTGRDGEVMDFLNPLSGKTFKARLEGSRAIINLGGSL